MMMSNDYSYIGDASAISKGYIAWEHMPVYDISNLDSPILGIEPSIDPTGLEPDLLVEFNPSAVGIQDYMNLAIRITNIGLVPLDLGDLDVKYYYTNDEGYPQSIAGNYIGGTIGNKCGNIITKTNVKVIEMYQPKQLADTYVSVTFDKDTGTLAYEDYVELNLQVYNTDWEKVLYMMKKEKVLMILVSLLFIIIFFQMNAYKKLNDMEAIYLKQLSNQNDDQILRFNNNIFFKYSDLSKKYRRQISVEEYQNISNIWQASSIFNEIDIKDHTNKILSKHISGPAVANQGVVGNKSYVVAHDIVLGIECFKPVVLSWKIYVY